MKKQFFLKIGFGCDLNNTNYTKASSRAILNALNQNQSFIGSGFNFSDKDLILDVKIGVQKPKSVNLKIIEKKIKKNINYGKINFLVVKGGMDLEVNGITKIVSNVIIGFSYEVGLNKVRG